MPHITPRIVCIDLEVDPTTGGLRVVPAGRPSQEARRLAKEQFAHVPAGVEALAQAEQARRRGSRTPLDALLRKHGEVVFELLDGPGRSLKSAIDDARKYGQMLLVVVRLVGAAHAHPASGWRLELLHDGTEHVTRRPDVQFVVQQGGRAVAAPERVDQGCLRVLFMAYSPQNVEPVLDYEREEEAILQALAPNVESGRVRIEVVEDGTLAELERRLKTDTYDVVYLSGHGELRADGPCLLLEDDLGDLDRVGTERLFRALERAQAMPRLVILSSCETADGRDDVASMAAGLVARGVPAVLGWVRPVADTDATQAGRDLLDRLATGHELPEAVAFARRQLVATDGERQEPTFGWSTLHLVVLNAGGFRIDTGVAAPESSGVTSSEVYRFLDDGRMRVLREGFVGRRRQLQRIVRVLRLGQDGDVARAGVAILGMKGVGKSCLAGRAIERHKLDQDRAMLLVLHGALHEANLLERVRRCALECDDRDAEKILDDVGEPAEKRLERLLAGRWKRRELVIVLDDFEQNLEVRKGGLARLSPFAARLLAVLLPLCSTTKAKVLITSTAAFELPPQLASALSEIELGPLESSDIGKLWTRGRDGDLSEVSPGQWATLAERLGRNARVLDWARALLGGRTTSEIDDLVKRAKSELPPLRAGVGDPNAQAQLAALFLFHAAIDRAQEEMHLDVRTFLERARVYEIAVPIEALLPMGEGLQLDLPTQIPALANLGLLEFGGFEGKRGYRVSPLVVAEFIVDDRQRWHRHAATFYEGEATTPSGVKAWLVVLAWEHSVAAQDSTSSERLGSAINAYLFRKGLYSLGHELALRHVRAFPHRLFSRIWAGDAARYAGHIAEARAHYSAGDQIVSSGNDVEPRFEAWFLAQFGDYLCACGDYVGARERLERAARILPEVHGTEQHLECAGVLHHLAVVLNALGESDAARKRIERSIEIKRSVIGTDDHLEVAVSLHERAWILHSQGSYVEAREQLERSLEIKQQVLGTDVHPSIAHSLKLLAAFALQQGDVAGARNYVDRSLEINRRVLGTDDHQYVADGLQLLAEILYSQGDLTEARKQFERAIEIQHNVWGTDERLAAASSRHRLALILLALEDLDGARGQIERALQINQNMLGTDSHPQVAECLHVLGRVLYSQGDLDGARERFESSLKIRRSLWGADGHPAVVDTLHELGIVLHLQGDLVAARECLERSVAILEKILDSHHHPSLAAALYELAMVYRAQGEKHRAVMLLRRVLEIEVAAYETSEHHSVAETEFALGNMLIEDGRREEGVSLVRHAIKVLSAQVPEHPIVSQAASTHSMVVQFYINVTLGIRAGEGRTPEFEGHLASLRAAGETTAIVASYLDWVSRGGDPNLITLESGAQPFDPVLASISNQGIQVFLERVRQAAHQMDAARARAS